MLPCGVRHLPGQALILRPFALERGPLIRLLLVSLAAREHVLFLSIHHIVFDGWSVGVFAEELRRLYEAFRGGQPSPLPAVPIQYVGA